MEMKEPFAKSVPTEAATPCFLENFSCAGEDSNFCKVSQFF